MLISCFFPIMLLPDQQNLLLCFPFIQFLLSPLMYRFFWKMLFHFLALERYVSLPGLPPQLPVPHTEWFKVTETCSVSMKKPEVRNQSVNKLNFFCVIFTEVFLCDLFLIGTSHSSLSALCVLLNFVNFFIQMVGNFFFLVFWAFLFLDDSFWQHFLLLQYQITTC